MAYAEDTISMTSAADLSSSEYKLVAVDANGKAALATAATDDLVGVLIDGGTASGEMVSVQHGGIAWVTLGGSVNEGDALTANGSSVAIATTTSGNRAIGRALEAGVSGDRIRVLLDSYEVV